MLVFFSKLELSDAYLQTEIALKIPKCPIYISFGALPTKPVFAWKIKTAFDKLILETFSESFIRKENISLKMCKAGCPSWKDGFILIYPSFKYLKCQVILMSYDATKQSVCGWLYIYIYIYRYRYIHFWLFHGRSACERAILMNIPLASAFTC